MSKDVNPNGSCIEKGTWTALPFGPPEDTSVTFQAPAGKLTFHMVGCSGDPSVIGPGLAVAAGMADQVTHPPEGEVAPAFLYHLGDIAYTDHGSDMTADLWNTQFFKQYKGYTPPIFAIAGNHDGKAGKHSPDTAEITFFRRNMCGTAGKVSPDNTADPSRTETAQPYPYWRLDTPQAYIIGLYSNVSNGGVLDDPSALTKPGDFKDGPQYKWLVDQLTHCLKRADGRAVLLALHYPPYNGAVDFLERGNPKFGADNVYPNATPIGKVLQEAYDESGQTPDAVFSAHSHLYQRLTVSYSSGGKVVRQVPHFVVGCGGHGPLELMAKKCDGGTATFLSTSFDLFAKGNPPAGLSAPTDATVTVDFWADGTDAGHQPFGFLRVTVEASLVCEFFAVACDAAGKAAGPAVLKDSCTVDLAAHVLK